MRRGVVIFFALSAGCVGVVGCEERARPWGSGEGPPVVLAPPTPGAARSEVVPQVGDAGEPGASDVDAGDGAAAPAAGDSPGAAGDPRITPGGGWVRCHEGLVLSGDPLKDVTRFGLLCGPSNGMRRKTRQALVGVIGEKDPAVTTSLRVARGACYRAFAVADAQVGELEVTFRSSRDVAVASDHGVGRLAVVQPDRPFCALADDVLTVEVRAVRGSGRFAAEVWSLGERRKRGDPADAPLDEGPLGDP